MADVKISALTDGGAVQDTDEFVAARGAGNVKILGSALGGSLAINVAAAPYNARGDGTADDTDAIQAAFDAAASAKLPVFFPNGTYKITAAITISRRGQRIIGANPWYAVISQATASAHAFTINDDTSTDIAVNGTTSNQMVVFEGVRILGLGAGTATGYGINAPGDGDWFEMRNCTVYGFARGVYLNGWAQSVFHNCVVHYCGYGLYFDSADSATNTIHLYNCGVAGHTTMGAYFNTGGGCTIVSGDWRGQPLAIQVGTGSGAGTYLTLLGGNFEAPNGGSEFIQVKASSRLVSTATQFQKAGGSADVDAVNVNGGSVVMIEPTFAGMAAGKVLVRKTNSTDIVQVIGTPTNLSTSYVSVGDPSTSYGHAMHPQRADNAVPAASAANRGLILQKMVRDAVSDQDELFFYAKDRKAGSDAYTRRTLSRVINGAGSPEGAVSAAPGTLYVNDSGGAGTTLYVKESGTGNTGWAAK